MFLVCQRDIIFRYSGESSVKNNTEVILYELKQTYDDKALEKI